MSILDQIYAGAKSVQTELKGMNAALKTMQQQDKAEYKLDSKDRRYEREKDKREAQDRKDFNKKVFDEVDKQSTTIKKEEDGKKLAAGLASATAAAIAEQVKKNKKQQKGVEGEGGPGFNEGLDGPTPKERRQTLSSSPITALSGQPTMVGQAVPIQDTSTEGRLKALEETVFTSVMPKPAKGFQSGGFAGAVPNLGQPTTGDHFYTHVQPGSYVLNRNAVAAMGFQGGGNVPVALEQGEIVIPPGQYDQKMMDFINYSAAPRFQEGGVTGKQEGRAEGEKVEEDESVKGKFGLVNPTPKTSIAQNKLGYAADTGLDIQGTTGDPIVAPAAGILEYLEKGHTSWKDDSDPGTPGYQPQHSFRIKLDSPFEYAGKQVNFAYGTHMSAISKELGNKKDVHVTAGTYLGNLGVANSVPHLHLGLVTDRPQTSFLNYKEVSAVLQGAPTTSASGDSMNNTGEGDNSTGGSQIEQKQEKGIFDGPFGGFFKKLDQELFGGGDNKFGLSLSMILGDPLSAFGNLAELGADMLMPGAEAKTLDQAPDQARDAQSPGGGSPSPGGSTSVEHGKWAPVLDLIAKHEAGRGGWEAMFPSTTLPGATNMTIAEVARKANGAAVGMYQNLPKYLIGRAKAVGLDPNVDKYNKENQIKIAEYLIGPGQANVTVEMARKNPKKAMYQLSKVWAAIPKDDSGVTYYNDGVNKAGIKPSQMYAAFKKLQKGGAVDMLSKVIGTDLNEFFKQSDMQMAQMAVADMEPTIINVGMEDDPPPQVTAHTIGKNLPDYNLPTRDSCPLSVYYRYHPSLNPQGINPS